MKRRRVQRKPEAPARNVTIRDIAREAGVSVATVSRAFAAPDRVREETREKIMAVSRRLHFVVNAVARSLASRRSGLIGLVIPSIYNSIYAASTQAIQSAAEAQGYTVLIGVSEFSKERETELIGQFVARRIEGLILTGVDRGRAALDMIKRERLPYVVTWHAARDRGTASVSFDNFAASAAVVDYLHELRHRHIALICGRTALNDRALARKQGFLKRMASLGLPAASGDVIECDFEFEEGRRALRTLLARRPRPTAIFSANDIVAVGVLHECRAQGLRVPEDISLVGFDDLPIAQYVTPQLSTVRVPAAAMGERAVMLLLQAIAGEPARSETLETELVVRGSAGRRSG
jgi:LacI family transcriptional regulator